MLYRTAILAAAIAIVFSSHVSATEFYHPIYHHMKLPISTAPSDPKPGTGNGGGAWCTGGCMWVGGFIAVIATAIVIHEIMGPACARPGLKNGYDEPRFWRPLCARNVVSVRG